MQYISLKEIQKAEFDILCKVVDFLDKNNLDYILCGGTMLGAIRHNGFIPWDDDIDILVPRESYNKLREKVQENKDVVNGISFQLPGTKDCLYPYMKAVDENFICADERFINSEKFYLWVDIFPMDHFPDKQKQHKKWLKKIEHGRAVLLSGIMTKAYHKERCKGNSKKYCKYKFEHFLYNLMGGYAKINRKIDYISQKINKKFTNSNHVGDGTWPNGIKDCFTVESIFPTIKHKFESRDFNIPEHYDLYLSHFYGEYMTPPDKNHREDHCISVYRARG